MTRRLRLELSAETLVSALGDETGCARGLAESVELLIGTGGSQNQMTRATRPMNGSEHASQQSRGSLQRA
jgi:hypothetical protein